MTIVAIFPSVLGVRQGVRDAAARLHADGHDARIVDVYAGRVFDDYPPAMAYAHETLGVPELLTRARAAVAELPDGFVTLGYSLGCVLATHVALQRRVTGVVMIAGAIPVSAFGGDARWPAGVPAQTHATLDDPWRDQTEVTQAIADLATSGQTLEVFDYPGRGHLFDDPSLPAEYDADAAASLWLRVLPFVRARAPAP